MTVEPDTPPLIFPHGSAWERFLPSLAASDNFLLLETNLPSPAERRNYFFTGPEEEIVAREPREVAHALSRIEDAVRGGFYAAGFFSYELGYCLDDNIFEPPQPHELPLLSIGLYRNPAIFDVLNEEWIGVAPAEMQHKSGFRSSPEFSISQPTLDETYQEYERKIDAIKHRIELGDTYQINYTLRMNFRFHGGPLAMYLSLRRRQKVAYSALWRAGGQSILSFSPELFFKIAGGGIETRPMKGTIARGATVDEDDSLRNFLRCDEKNRAENLMIVDLLRNDLGRVAVPGTVEVPRLFDIEPYETLSQMTSTVRAKLEPGAGLQRIVAALFPCGSVTGAPKISSMKIIRSLENSPRGAYTGAIGFIAPGMREAAFNVAIRTIHLSGEKGEMGAGGGIVYDSSPESEWREVLLKCNFLTHAFGDVRPKEFSLIETLSWTREGGFFLLDLHIARMEVSAAHFGITFAESDIRRALEDALKNTPSGTESLRVRLLLSTSGEISASCNTLDSSHQETPQRCTLCPHTVLSSNPFLYHKTTVRTFYDAQRQKFAARGFFDVIFVNERGEITEGAITNVVARIGDRLYTPPVECGLLPGVFRRHLIDTGRVRERILFPEDLSTADEILLCNSVRGLFKVEYSDPVLK